MTSPTNDAAHSLGTHLAAMVTPMTSAGDVSWQDVSRLVDHLVDGGCDGIVVAGTTGEAPTLTLAETVELVRHVKARTMGAARVIAGVGTNVTSTSVIAAAEVEDAGADGLLVVTPYYSRPSQEGIIAHCRAITDATDLPVMLYDVPSRTGTAMTVSTLTRLSSHPQILAVKDAKGDLWEAMEVMGSTGLAYYCGIDQLNLPYLASGAIGLVSVTANVDPGGTSALIQAVAAGHLDEARGIAHALAPLTHALMQPGPAACTAKAALVSAGVIEHPAVRLPLMESGALCVEALTRQRPGSVDAIGAGGP
ncbi:4-hydroxy-tetrahydrodipicolinate synthase [Janibacter limosus]|uniref:4-hydroxy-tetrahydrodipicolinate synthase n=2 Tax=Janibacter limosus TaxID=53458 RepID=A0A4P6MW19_9MICO|nr:4-hydroxy-tetrahydrodipicolinate synthase [Janibacter limosus]